MTGAFSGKGPRLNHVEFAHRPGEGPLAVLLFEALGCSCSVIDTPPYGAYVVVSLDGSPHGQNDMFASEAEPEQLALEKAMAGAGIGSSIESFRTLQRERPYRVNHIGMRIPRSQRWTRTSHGCRRWPPASSRAGWNLASAWSAAWRKPARGTCRSSNCGSGPM